MQWPGRLPRVRGVGFGHLSFPGFSPHRGLCHLQPLFPCLLPSGTSGGSCERGRGPAGTDTSWSLTGAPTAAAVHPSRLPAFGLTTGTLGLSPGCRCWGVAGERCGWGEDWVRFQRPESRRVTRAPYPGRSTIEHLGAPSSPGELGTTSPGGLRAESSMDAPWLKRGSLRCPRVLGTKGVTRGELRSARGPRRAGLTPRTPTPDLSPSPLECGPGPGAHGITP